MEYKFNDAERVLQKAVKTNPNHGDLHYNFSLLYFACRKLDNALTYINKAINISINNDIYKILKSEIYINNYNFDEALKILKVLIAKIKIIKILFQEDSHRIYSFCNHLFLQKLINKR